MKSIIRKFRTPRGLGTSGGLANDSMTHGNETFNQTRQVEFVTSSLIGWGLGHPQADNGSRGPSKYEDVVLSV